MNEQIRQIASRLRGLREVLEFTIDEAAGVCHTTADTYLKYESGTIDIPVSVLHSISKHYHIELTALIAGEEPHVFEYSITRKGTGVGVHRRGAYQYESLASTFVGRKAEPFVVTVEPNGEELKQSSHVGQEFNFVLEGEMELRLNNKKILLHEGDSIYFNSAIPHSMSAVNNLACKFLVLILK
ncbi:helix-turn-helix domain-containing protein [Labilibaculum sp.]|uniref:helix-turn-helix domain-containing protein n=1 Tax=Labilibaculum sp. TaxID=2060723 RepID=UPI00356743B1